jgi:hypothetical protein
MFGNHWAQISNARTNNLGCKAQLGISFQHWIRVVVEITTPVKIMTVYCPYFRPLRTECFMLLERNVVELPHLDPWWKRLVRFSNSPPLVPSCRTGVPSQCPLCVQDDASGSSGQRHKQHNCRHLKYVSYLHFSSSLRTEDSSLADPQCVPEERKKVKWTWCFVSGFYRKKTYHSCAVWIQHGWEMLQS